MFNPKQVTPNDIPDADLDDVLVKWEAGWSAYRCILKKKVLFCFRDGEVS